MEKFVRRVLLNSFPRCHFLGFLACCSIFFLLYSSWIIKKCCDSQYDCESGAAALNCVVTFACFSLSSQCSPCLFSCFLTWFVSQSVMLQSSRPKISPWRGKRGDFQWWIPKKSCLPSSTERELFAWICIQVRVLFTGEGKGREGYFSFPSCTSSRTQIGTEGWAVSPGISILSLAWLPPRETCQRLPFTTTHMPVVFSNITKDPRDQHIRPPAADLPPRPMNSPLLFFMLLQIPMAAKLDVPMALWHCRSHSGFPEKRLWKQLLADEKFMQCYHIFENPRLIISPSLSPLFFSPSLSPSLFPSLFLDDAQMTHQSVQHMGLGLFCLWSVGEF